eukprot:359029-Chlamydomonas_euryale.AAC.2
MARPKCAWLPHLITIAAGCSISSRAQPAVKQCARCTQPPHSTLCQPSPAQPPKYVLRAQQPHLHPGAVQLL